MGPVCFVFGFCGFGAYFVADVYFCLLGACFCGPSLVVMLGVGW